MKFKFYAPRKELLMNELQYQSCPFWILKQKQSQTSLENIQTCLATTRSLILAYVYRIDSNKKKFFKMPHYTVRIDQKGQNEIKAFLACLFDANQLLL